MVCSKFFRACGPSTYSGVFISVIEWEGSTTNQAFPKSTVNSMNIAQVRVYWKRLTKLWALPGWAILIWKTASAFSTLSFVRSVLNSIHWDFLLSPVGNLLTILFGLGWLALAMLLPRRRREENLSKEISDAPPTSLPAPIDTSVKDSDPQLEIKFVDLRGKTMSEDKWCFDLINHGKQSPARFTCIEDFYIDNYYVAFRNFPPPIKAFDNHDSITALYINNPDGSRSKKDIFSVLYEAWDARKNPKLYSYPVPIKATYQDDFRNLFEARCDLVFYPGEHINTAFGKQLNGNVVEIKNLKLRKVGAVQLPINWTE
jgi:hypothetical protein